jgi:hypothetical protein
MDSGLSRFERRIRGWRARHSNPRYLAAALGLPLTKNERRLGRLRNAHAGERCFIIGNGPSLNLLDLTLLTNEVTFGVNAIYTNYPKMGFYPTYYVVEDYLVAEDRAPEINAYGKSRVKFFGNYLRYCLQPDSSTVVLNILLDYRDYPDFPHFSRNALEKVWVGGTVSYVCMQLAYYMGFSQVYLVGFDHSYSVPKDAAIQEAVITSRSGDVNHFDASYFGAGKRWHDPRVDRMAKAYARAAGIFATDGRLIRNATAGGMLDIFERVDYRTLFTQRER